MIKIYCDRCGVELKETNRLRLCMGHIAVEIIHYVDRCANKGHVCHKCIKEIVAKGEQWKE